MVTRASGKRALWKRSVQVLFSQAIFGEEKRAPNAGQDRQKRILAIKLSQGGKL